MKSDIKQILNRSPVQKQMMMFSATMPEDIKKLSKDFMKNPFELIVDDESKLNLDKVAQYFVKLNENEKNKKLNEVLEMIKYNQVIIFVKNVPRCKELCKLLNKCNFPSVAIHRDLPQEERINLFTQFRDFGKRIMVATDIFGRGIDILRVNFVINYDMPENPESYIHRVGRAGRFESKGISITFIVGEADQKIFDETIKKYAIKNEVLPEKIDPETYCKLFFFG